MVIIDLNPSEHLWVIFFFLTDLAEEGCCQSQRLVEMMPKEQYTTVNHDVPTPYKNILLLFALICHSSVFVPSISDEILYRIHLIVIIIFQYTP